MHALAAGSASESGRGNLARSSTARSVAPPSPEILGREVGAHCVAQIIIDLARVDRVPLTCIVQILEQTLAGEFVAMPHDARKALVVNDHLVLESTFPSEAEAQSPVAHETNVPVAQRGQAEAAVCPRILVVAHADAGGIEQAHDRGQDAFAGHTCAGEVVTQAPAQARQCGAERRHALELRAVAHQSPLRVIPVLFAATRIAAGRLQVSARIDADPHCLIRRRNREAADALECGVIADGSPAVTDISKSGVVAHAANAAARIAHIDETGGVRHLGRVGGAVGKGREAHECSDCG
jgi:hypothetical protein